MADAFVDFLVAVGGSCCFIFGLAVYQDIADWLASRKEAGGDA